jgi:hypothetical protein
LIKSPPTVKLVITAILILYSSLGTGCSADHSFEKHLGAITRPYHFSIASWELEAFGELVRKAFCERQRETGVEASKVSEYYSDVEQIKEIESEIAAIGSGKGSASLEMELSRLQKQNAALTDTVERTIETQIRATLSQQGIFNPIDKYVGLKAVFPPVNFVLGVPPHLLVVSPRDRIESLREITLLPEMSVEDMEALENEVDKLGVSSLVVDLGGLSTYPSYITGRAGLPFTIETAVHEWLHQYLAFKPLGFRYVLDVSGICRNYEIATMNETLVSMVSKEIGAMVYNRYYVQSEEGNAEPAATGSGFDFNQEMREIRRAVDGYLAQGKIEAAEAFMEQKRQYLATKGYYIRKLNQAYFAFHGTYADSPTSISPIGDEMKKLRSQSASVKDFLETAAAMTSRQDLSESIK